jgi:MFS family permease
MAMLNPLPVGVSFALCMAVAGNVLIGIGDLLTSFASDVGESSVSFKLEWLFLVRGIGQLIATPIAAELFNVLNGNTLLLYCLGVITFLWLVSSFITTTSVLYLWFFASGLITATLDTGTQILTRRIYDEKAGPWLTANTLMFASAGLISPLVSYVTENTFQQTLVYAVFAVCVSVLLYLSAEVPLYPKSRLTEDEVRWMHCIV